MVRWERRANGALVAPELAKRLVNKGKDGQRDRLGQMRAMSLVQNTRAGVGKQQKDVTILDIFKNAASVKVAASD